MVGDFPLPSWNMIWNWLSNSDQGSWGEGGGEGRGGGGRDEKVSACIHVAKHNMAEPLHNTLRSSKCLLRYIWGNILYLSSGHLYDNTAHTPNVHWPTHVMFENHLRRHVGWGKAKGGEERTEERKEEEEGGEERREERKEEEEGGKEWRREQAERRIEEER